MKVIHTIPALFSRERGVLGGAERYAYELARAMSVRTPTTLLSFASEADEYRDGELRVKLVPNPWPVRGDRLNPFAPEVIPEIARHDVVHAHHQHLMLSSIAAIVAQLTGTRAFVSDLGGGGWDISGYMSTDSWYQGHLHISEYSRRVFGHQDLATASVIYGGVDTDRFRPAESQVSGRRALFVGRLLPHKGVDYLIEAIDEDLALDIAGWSDNAEYIELLHALAEDRDVRFLGPVDDAELVGLYQQALCIVLPSVYEPRTGGRTEVPELLGQTLLEGMACGRPAICTDVASMPEIVNRECGYVVQPNSPTNLRRALRSLTADSRVTDELGSAARRRVLNHFTWPTVVERCLNAYEATSS